MPPSHSRPEFFLDRSLARRIVADLLRSAVWNLRTHIEVYGERDQDVPDVEWLELCGRSGWAVLTKDARIRRRRAEVAVIRRHGVKAFVLAAGNMRAVDQARRFDDNRAAIEAACADRGPFVYAVRAGGLERIFPE